MPNITANSMRGRFCNDLSSWFADSFGEEADEVAVVQKAVEDGHIDAVVEYLHGVITEQDVLDRVVAALAAVPAVEGDRWKDIVDEANMPTPDIIRIRSVMDGWPDDERLTRGVLRLSRTSIGNEAVDDRPGLWLAILGAVRAV